MWYERYQVALITLGVIATAMFAGFLYKEIFPEYRIYQDDYVELEKFRSTYTGEPPPAFAKGVKQIVFEREDKGPAEIDRCISCHVAEQLPHFSPTKIAYDVNGNIQRTADGTPIQVPNEDYVWAKLDQRIAELRDSKVIAQLEQNGESSAIKEREKEAQYLESLKTAKVGDQIYDVTKVIRMHPLIGKETRPFQFHSLDEYGCTSCHSGNGRGLTTTKAHGPVFDGTYDIEYEGPEPQFLEEDPQNDPAFAHVFNHKPSDSLLFQTTPILVGKLIQAQCVQCHQQSSTTLQELSQSIKNLTDQRQRNAQTLQAAYDTEKAALLSLLELKQSILKQGYQKTIEVLKIKTQDPYLSPKEHDVFNTQLAFLQKASTQQAALEQIHHRMLDMIGSDAIIQKMDKALDKEPTMLHLTEFLNAEQDDANALGTLFDKWHALNLEISLLEHVEDTQRSFSQTADDQAVVSSMASDVDWLIKDYHRGRQLFVSQACYACHRVATMSRGGVGPELTRSGYDYPWYLKHKMEWPQGTLPTSTMPNMLLDEIELEDLMTYLLAQKGPTKVVSATQYKQDVQLWETSIKMPWEKPLPPSEIHNVREAMMIFATQGCAACHRLEGYESNVGFKVEKNKKASFDDVYKQKMWFRDLFAEEMRGSAIVEAIEKNADTIDQRIVDNVRKDAILEEIQETYPEGIQSFYSNFRYAARAKNHQFSELAKNAKSTQEKNQALKDLKAWQDRVHRVLMMYIQEYGFGRLIGPRPNWSGVYRSDQWLMEHFHNPSGHVPRSIMPIFPFDETKFYALTHMLNVVGKRNRDSLHEIWRNKGFNPSDAFQRLCAQCHGEFLLGNGPVATWIYPVPKNLRNSAFLRNLTRENALDSIRHGVKGTPMPPWSEAPKDNADEDGIPVLSTEQATQLVDWMFSSLPGGTIIRGTQDVPKWQYTPKDVLEEMRREGSDLKGDQASDYQKESSLLLNESSILLSPKYKHYYAALEPIPARSEELNEVAKYFDIVPNPNKNSPEHNLYYIKKNYYTVDNIEAGRRFFELNCAVCHGAEADGSGTRAGVMLDAKPRMLTNLDWLNTRDDLRLLRSIKYGVLGTSMTPWGDQTSSLQRMQLVIFIRSLTSERERRIILSDELYKSFTHNISSIEDERIGEYAKIEGLQKEYEELQKQRRLEQSKSRESAIALYEKQFEVEDALNKKKDVDQYLVEIIKILTNEHDFYLGLGNDMISLNVDNPIWNPFLDMLSLNAKRAKHESDIIDLSKHIDKQIDLKIQELKNQMMEQEKSGTFSDEQQQSLNSKLMAYTKLKNKLLSGLEEEKRRWKQIDELFKKYEQHKNKQEKSAA